MLCFAPSAKTCLTPECLADRSRQTKARTTSATIVLLIYFLFGTYIDAELAIEKTRLIPDARPRKD